MGRTYAYVCLINAIYDIGLGIISLLPDPMVTWDLMSVARLFGVCQIALGLGLIAAFRNLENVPIIPLINIVANLGMALDYLFVAFALPLPLSYFALPFAIIPALFGILLLAYMLTAKGSFSAAFRAAPKKG